MSDIETAEADRSTRALSRIAEALDCPVEALRTGEGLPLSLTGLSELVALWDTLKTDASRQGVLELVRAAAAAEKD